MPPMLQVPPNTAPGSIDNFAVIISPCNLAVLFNVSNSLTLIVPSRTPSTSALEQVIFPSMFPSGPITNLPLVETVPFTFPSIRMFPSEIISPSMEVPATIRFNLSGELTFPYAIVSLFPLNILCSC